MTHFTRFATALVALSATAAVGAAQGRGRMDPPMPPGRAAVTAPVTAEQREQLRTLMRTQAEERTALEARHRQARAALLPDQMGARTDARPGAAARGGLAARRGPVAQRGPAMHRGAEVRRGSVAQRPQAQFRGRGPHPGFVPPGQLRRRQAAPPPPPVQRRGR